MILSDLFPLDKISERFECQLVLKVDNETTDKKINAVMTALEKNAGKTPVMIAVGRNGHEYMIKSNRFAVNPELKLMNKLKELLGNSAVYLQRPQRQG